MSAPITVRPAEAEDADYARNVIGAIRDALAWPLDRFEATTLAELPASFRSAGGNLWVLVIQGTIAGAVGVAPKGDLWTLAGPYVLPQWRRMGLGRLLVESALEVATGEVVGVGRADDETAELFWDSFGMVAAPEPQGETIRYQKTNPGYVDGPSV